MVTSWVFEAMFWSPALFVSRFVLAPQLIPTHYLVGKGTGFGNKISIQTKDIVRCGKSAGKVFNVAEHDEDVSAVSELDSLTDT